MAKKDADEINKAYEEFKSIRKKINDLVNKFIEEHKSYHLTISDKDFFDTFFDNFWLF